jgi:asparagine synthase (glutamine-hydrolysing)
MSGICAVLARQQALPQTEVLERMVAAAPHRATGGVEAHVTEHLAAAQLTHRGALERGAAPAVDHRTGVVVVADARIDNARELRVALGRDAPRQGAVPAELVAATYLRWGSACLGRLIGDFAVVIWDPRIRSLILARDPLAMRALYYRVEPDRVLVATEAAQLLAVPGVPDEPDERTVAAYLAGNFGSLEWSYYRGIAQVAPSHAVAIGESGVRRWRFWDIDPEHCISYPRPEGYAEHLRELFVDAVRARTTGGRTAGVLLSGGIDSGALASVAGWLMHQEGAPAQLHSYSFDFGALTQCDERHISRHIVEAYGLVSTDVPVEDAGPLAGYPAHEPHVDDPFHGHFQTMLDRGYERARKDGVGPLFTGRRGDLVIGPVDVNYVTLLHGGRLIELAGELRRHQALGVDPLGAILRRDVLPQVSWLARRSAIANWARWALRRTSVRPSPVRGGPDPGRLPPWIRPELAERVGLDDLVRRYAETRAPPVAGPLRRRRYEWIFAPMHLRWAASHERRVARFGMEAVDAWSDRRIAEFCVAVPQQALDAPYSVDKRLVREALTGIMPDLFLRQSGKTLPGPLFRRGLAEAAPLIRRLLADSRAEAVGWLDAASLTAAFERSVGAGAAPPGELWWALSVEWWLRVLEDRGTV